MSNDRVLQLAQAVLSNRPTNKVAKIWVKAKVYRRKALRKAGRILGSVGEIIREEPQNSEGTSV